MTDISFLSDKFTPVKLPEIYASRDDLLSAYHLAAKDNFIYVGSQAGSGKTVSTLLWLNACKRKTIWIGLDQYDSVPSVFYKQLSTGFFSAQPHNKNMEEILIESSFSSSPIENTVRIISEIQPNKELYALVLDDMHLIDNRKILKSLPVILRRLPRNFVTVILSRHDLPEEFQPLVKNETINNINSKQLRFSQEEIFDYFNSLGQIISIEESHAAYMATEGWAIGVNVVSKSGEIQKANAYTFSSYFENQIWNKWTQSLRSFCLATSILDEFSPALAKTLSGEKDAQEILEQLSSTNSFLNRVRENTYRYHHLFQDFLRKKLLELHIDMSEIYKKAAHYYKGKGDYPRALRYWIDSGDFRGINDYLYAFMSKNKFYMTDSVDFLKIFYVKGFPKNIYEEAPALHILAASYYHLTSRHEEFAYHMDAIIENIPRIIEAKSEFTTFLILGINKDHRKSFKEKITMYEKLSCFLNKNASKEMTFDLDFLTHHLPYLHRSSHDYSEIALNPSILNDLETTFAQMWTTEWTYLCPCMLGGFAYEQNKLDAALKHAEQAIQNITQNITLEGKISGMILQHSIFWQMDNKKKAKEIMQELTEFVESKAQFFLPNLMGYQAKLRLLNGDLAIAKEWLDNYFVVETNHIEVFNSFRHFITARVYMALVEIDKAKQYLIMLKDYGINLNRPLDRSEAGILLSIIYWAKGQKNEAIAELESTLEITQAYGYIRIISDEGSAIIPLLKKIIQIINKENYTGKLKRSYINEIMFAALSFSKQHKGYFNSLELTMKKDKTIKLSKQQKLILTLLYQGYRNAEICEMTELKLTTIKTHTSYAYKKLGVTNSVDAILKAQELNLL